MANPGLVYPSVGDGHGVDDAPATAYGPPTRYSGIRDLQCRAISFQHVLYAGLSWFAINVATEDADGSGRW